MTWTSTCLTAVAAVALLPLASADAATITREALDGGVTAWVVVTEPGLDDVINVYQRGDALTFGFVDAPQQPLRFPASCRKDAMDGVVCPADADAVVVDGGEGHDRLIGNGEASSLVQVPMVLLGGPGDDLLAGGAHEDGLDGGPGRDTLRDTPSADVLDAGAGDDALESLGPDAPGDVLDGGEGRDLLTVERAGPHAWTLDDAADDGEAGEGDRVLGVEDLTAQGEATVVLVGDDGPNRLSAGLFGGGRTVRGGGGDDELHGGLGADDLDGGPGADVVRGEQGDDRLDGGPGQDSIIGDGQSGYAGFQAGNDTVLARDGEADRIDCGFGADRAVVDAGDAVVSCATVERPPAGQAPAPAPGGGGGGSAAPATGPAPAAAPAPSAPPAAAPAAAPASGELTGTARPALRLAAPLRDHRARFRFALRGSVAAAPGCAGERVTVTVRRAGRVVLRRRAVLDRRCAFAVVVRLRHRGRHTAALVAAGARATVVLRAG